MISGPRNIPRLVAFDNAFMDGFPLKIVLATRRPTGSRYHYLQNSEAGTIHVIGLAKVSVGLGITLTAPATLQMRMIGTLGEV